MYFEGGKKASVPSFVTINHMDQELLSAQNLVSRLTDRHRYGPIVRQVQNNVSLLFDRGHKCNKN